MARAVQGVAQRAREKKLLPDDLQGGTITITNPGGYGALFGTPIISQPQSANIGVYAIVKRPVVVTDEHGNDSLAIRQMMYMSVTYDHRLIDGAYGAQFARAMKERLESWD
jgi:2-oxoglutarate dehydrogenase E2 component (dihydrolipoamide succinyltransferase)